MNSPPSADTYPLSPLQEGMLFESLYSPGSGVDVMQRVIHVDEPLDIPRLRRAWDGVVAENGALRTSFCWQGLEAPRQVVHGQGTMPLREVDWSALSEETWQSRWQSLLAADRSEGFDLSNAPLSRVTVVNTPRGARLLWTVHHALMDGPSLVLVLRQVFEQYDADDADDADDAAHESTIASAPPFSDYVQWVRGLDTAAAEVFWKERLGRIDHASRLSTHHDERGAQGPADHARLETRWSGAATSALKSWARDQGLTLNIAVQGAWAMLLSRYCGQRSIVFGAVKTCRRSSVPGAEAMLGPLINTLPIAVDVDPEAEIGDWLGRLRRHWLVLRDFEHTPLVRIQEWSGLTGPLFESILCFDPDDFDGAMRAAGARWERRHTEVLDQTAYPLALNVFGGDQLTFHMTYDARSFDAAAVGRVLDHLGTMLEGMASATGRRVGDLSMMRPAERERVLIEWNDTATPYPHDRCIHELFEQQVARRADAVAVADGQRSLSYRELDERANQLAHCLRERGVGPEVAVATLVPRSVDLIVALLGILKAGGAYVPLDAQSPKARLAGVLRDAGIRWVLTQRAHRRDLPEDSGDVICLDAIEAELAARPATRLDNTTSPHNLAYVVHTSGSTGSPKGICIPHRGVVRLVMNTDYAELTAGDVIPQIAPVSFDAATFEVWGSLLNGARLEVMPPHTQSAEELSRAIEDRGVTTMFLTTALFRQLVDGDLARLRSVRQLLSGGETHSVAHIRRYLDSLADGRRFMNVYGPTESTTFTTCHAMPPDVDIGGSAPIGRPIANTRVYVLDPQLNPVPVGVPGELWIGGDGLARGYLDPRLTAERFVPDPFGGEPGSRIYGSGDLARYRDDGAIEFLGRLDDQVKIRGYRVEPGEVEAALLRAPAVAAAAVVVREDSPGERRLVAYVVAAPGEACESDELRRFLSECLPVYMVPSAILALDEIPLNANGKIDRDALPAANERRVRIDLVSPRNPVEAAIAAIWTDLLPVERVGVRDDFFDLGGHSLLAMQVISRLRDVFGVEIALADLFERPTVAELAERVGAVGVALPGTGNGQHLESDQPEGSPPLSFAERRLWFLQRMYPHTGNYNVAVAWRIGGPVQREALETCLAQLAERHEILRTTYAEEAGSPVRVAHPPGPLAVSTLDVAGAGDVGVDREQRARAILDGELARPFDLASERPWRVFLARLGQDDHVLLIVLHHIATDGWSLAVLAREFGELYSAHVEQRPPELPALSTDPADHARRQLRELRPDLISPQIDYWKRKLAGVESLDLPLDRPRPPLPSFAGSVVSVQLPAIVSEALERLGRRADASLFMALLAAFDVVLQRHTGQSDIVVGSPVAGRGRTELEGLLGCFVNTLPLRTDLSGDPTFLELLGRVRTDVLDALGHQSLPFERLVEELDPERDPSRNPVFQVLFAVQNAPVHDLALKGLSVAPFPFARSTTHLDLDVHIWPGAEGLRIDLVYNTDLFDAATVERMAGHYRVLLEGAVADPEARVSCLPLLLPEERRQLLEWNATERDHPAHTLHALFEAQVDRTPDAIAVSFPTADGHAELSYRELDARANRLARHLLARGVAAPARVGLCLPRSIDAVVGVLAILKSGAAYVPLEPEHPPDRLQYMATDAGLEVVLSDRALGSRLPSPVRVVAIDAEQAEIDSHGADRTGIATRVDDLAYVIYTSGSTGRPKGVELSHRSVCNRLSWMRETYPLRSDDRVLHKTPLGFDISVWELFWPLITGACLVVARPDGHRDPAYLHSAITRHRVTTVHFVPSMLRAFLETSGVETPTTVRRVFCSGEALAPDLRDLFVRRMDAELHNLYGPTEAAIEVTACRCDQAAPGSVVPIGRPIDNTTAWVLDEALQPVPIGVAGELCLGGVQLARGYRGRPALTAESFVPDPFGGRGGRLYRTGDRARCRADGMIEYLGRADHQVKVRGHRIELGEIEAVALEHEDVRGAVAVVREDRPGDRRLVLHVVWRGSEPVEAELRRFLASVLPDALVPSAILELDSVPLTPNGKIDRRRVAAIRPPARPRGPRVAPRTPTESIVARVFGEILDLEDVSAADDFFEAGGHSLLAVQLTSRIRDALGQDLPISRVFEAPTVEALARCIDRLVAEAGPVLDASRERGVL